MSTPLIYDAHSQLIKYAKRENLFLQMQNKIRTSCKYQRNVRKMGDKLLTKMLFHKA